MKNLNFVLINSEYINTGGHCMVTNREVYIPEDNCTLYIVAATDSVLIATADIIRFEAIDGPSPLDDSIIYSARTDEVENDFKYFEAVRECWQQHMATSKKMDDIPEVGIEVPYNCLPQKDIDIAMQELVDGSYTAEEFGYGLADIAFFYNGYETKMIMPDRD